MVAKKRTKVTRKNSKVGAISRNSVDVTDTKDIPKLAELMKKNKFIVVLIWANYCGHCHTYKDQVWNKLLNSQGRKAGLASIHYDQLETTPPSIPKKVSGYPTVLFIGKDGKPVKFKDENTGSTNLEYPKSRDLGVMSNIVKSDDPESLLENKEEETPSLSRNSEMIASTTSPDDVLNSVNYDKVPSKSKLVAPNPSDDMLNSQSENKPLTVEKGEMDSGNIDDVLEKSKRGGGSLFKALLSIVTPKTQTRSSHVKRAKQTRRISR